MVVTTQKQGPRPMKGWCEKCQKEQPLVGVPTGKVDKTFDLYTIGCEICINQKDNEKNI